MMEDGAVAGVVFESKEGRLAIRARVAVDCTGDGDMFARAGAGADTDIEERDIHHCMNTSWLFGGVDMTRWIAFKTGEPRAFPPSWRAAATLCGGCSSGRSCPGATTSRCSWGRGCRAIRRSTSRT